MSTFFVIFVVDAQRLPSVAYERLGSLNVHSGHREGEIRWPIF